MTYKIKILSEVVGSEDAFSVRRFYRDEILTVPTDIRDTLARYLIQQGKATEDYDAAE